MMYLIIVWGIYYLLNKILNKEPPDDQNPANKTLQDDSPHPAEIQLRRLTTGTPDNQEIMPAAGCSGSADFHLK